MIENLFAYVGNLKEMDREVSSLDSRNRINSVSFHSVISSLVTFVRIW